MILFFIGILSLIIIFCIWIHTAPIGYSGDEALVVLGYRCINNEIHPFLRERLTTSLQLIRKYPFKKIILSGGTVASIKAEAEIMKNFLLNNGVENERILVDNMSRDTIENIINIKKIMEEESITSCIIVTNSFHIRRVCYITRKIGLKSNFYAKRGLKPFVEQFISTLNEMKIFINTFILLKKIEKRG